MVERNTVIGIAFLTIGTYYLIVFSLGYRVARNVPIASFCCAVALIGAVILLVVPEAVPQDAYKALLNDAIGNIEMIMKAWALREKAYFLQAENGEIRAFIPIPQSYGDKLVRRLSFSTLALLEQASARFVADYGDMRGLLLIPPGAELVKLARVEKGADLQEALRSVLVEFSDLASSVLAFEEEGSKIMKIQIRKPTVTWESPFFNACLGSSVSCIAGCVAAAVKGRPVKIIDERLDPALVRLSLEMV